MALSQKVHDWFAQKAGYSLDDAFEIQQTQQGSSVADGSSYAGRGYPAFGKSVSPEEKDEENLALLDTIASSR